MASPTSEVAEPITMAMEESTSKEEPGNFGHVVYFFCLFIPRLLFHTGADCEHFRFSSAEAETKADTADLDDWEAMASDEERGNDAHN